MFAVFAIEDGDGALTEIEFLDAQAHGFHEAKAAAIHHLGDQFPRVFETSEYGADFLSGHDDGRAALATSGGDIFECEFGNAEDMSGVSV